jgi:hypothetical protein
VSAGNTAAPPLPSQLLVPHPFSLSPGVAPFSGFLSPRSRWAWRAGGRGDAGAEGRRRGGGDADWSDWKQEESGARPPATRNGHRRQLRPLMAFARLGRGECGSGGGFLRRVAEAAAGVVVVPTGPPSQGSIPAPLPRSPASGGARRRGFDLDVCWRRGAAGSARGGGSGGGLSPVSARDSAGATAPARRGGTPDHDRAVGEAAAIVLRVYTSRRQRAAAGRRRRRRPSRRRLGCPAAPSAGRCSLHRRAVEAHGSLLLSSPIAGPPPTPPFESSRMRCDRRPAPPATPSPPIRPPHSKLKDQPQLRKNSSTKHMYV